MNLRVLRPLNQGTSGSTLTPADTSRPSRRSGHFPDFPWPGSPWLAHGSPLHGVWFPNPMGLLFSAFGLPSHPMSRSPLPHPVTGPIPTSRGFPIPPGCRAAPFHPTSRVYTPPGRQQPSGTGPLDPHPSGDRFVRVARVAPFLPPPPSPVPRPVTHLGLFPVSRAFPVSWGRCVALATRASLSRPLFPASRVYTPPGRQQPFGAGSLDPHPSGYRFVCLPLVASFPPPSAWVVCFLQDLWWVLLPGPPAPR